MGLLAFAGIRAGTLAIGLSIHAAAIGTTAASTTCPALFPVSLYLWGLATSMEIKAISPPDPIEIAIIAAGPV